MKQLYNCHLPLIDKVLNMSLQAILIYYSDHQALDSPKERTTLIPCMCSCHSRAHAPVRI